MPDRIVKPANQPTEVRSARKEKPQSQVRLSTLRLALLAGALVLAVGLAATNPTMDEYIRYIEVRLVAEIEKMDRSAPQAERNLIKGIFRMRGIQLGESVVRPNTKRRNWGLLSVFETRVLDENVLVLGVADQFIPLHGLEDVTGKVGRLAF